MKPITVESALRRIVRELRMLQKPDGSGSDFQRGIDFVVSDVRHTIRAIRRAAKPMDRVVKCSDGGNECKNCTHNGPHELGVDCAKIIRVMLPTKGK